MVAANLPYKSPYYRLARYNIDILQQVKCDIMYIQQSIPQITIHLSYIDTLQQVNCDIMYIQQNTPQITIHMLYIDALQYFNYFKSTHTSPIICLL